MKKKVTRLISAVLSAAIALSSIPISAFAEGEVHEHIHEHASDGSTAVTERLDLASKTEDESGSGWSWEADTKTLTLDSIDISCAVSLNDAQSAADIAVVYVPDKTEIVLVGENTIEQTSTEVGIALYGEGSITFSGDGVLNVKNVSHDESVSHAIYTQDSSVIVNGGTVNTDGTVVASTVEVHNNGVLNAKATAYSLYGAAVHANVTVDGNGTLTAVGSADEDSSYDNGAIVLSNGGGKMTVTDNGSITVPADNAAAFAVTGIGGGEKSGIYVSGGKMSLYGTSAGLSNVVLNMSGTGSVYATGKEYATSNIVYKESDYFMTAGSAAYGTEESAVTETELTKDEYGEYFIGGESVKTLVVKPETRQKIILGKQTGRFTVSEELYEGAGPMDRLDGSVSFDIVPLNISNEEFASATAVISDDMLTARIYEDGDNWVCVVFSYDPYGEWYQYVEGIEDAELYITYGDKKSNTQTVRIKQDYYDDMDVRASQQYPTLYTNAPDSVKQYYYATVKGSTSDGTVTNSWYVRGDSKYTLDQLGEVCEDGTKFKISDNAPMGNFTVYCDTVRTKTDGTESVLTNKFSFEKKECKHENGYDSWGRCKDCESDCPHNGDIDADTGKCKICGYIAKSASFTSNNGEVTLFGNAGELKTFFDNNSTANGTLKLFRDVFFSHSGEPISFNGNVTIDFNGSSFNGGIGSSAGGNTITLENSSAAQATAFSLSTGYGSKAVVNGNILFKDVVTAGSGGGIIVLNNGEYKGLQQNNSGKSIYDMLGDKKAFYNSDGTVLNVGGMQHRSTSEAAVTVKAHEHTFVGNNCECGFVCEHEVNTDTGVCGKCGYKFTALMIKDGAVASVYNQTETASAFASADSEENKGCTLELFGDYSGDYTTLSGEFTLLLASGVNAGDLTVIGNITVSGDENNDMTYAAFTVNGGTLVFDEKCSVSSTVTAGEGSRFECYSRDVDIILNITGEDSEISLADGVFSKITYTGGGSRANDSILTLLAPKKAFWGIQQNSVIDGSIYKMSDGISRVIIYPHENHAFDSTTGKCTECGAYCDHSNTNTDTGVCGECGHEFALGVLSDSGNKFYDDADTVFENLPDGKTVKLYRNCSVSLDSIDVGVKEITVDLNGFTLSGDGLYFETYEGTALNVIDSKSGGVFNADILVWESSVLNIGTEDGENNFTVKYIDVTTENGGKLNMYGGVCDALDIDDYKENIAANINIYGGTVKSIRCGSSTATLNMLLADGYAFENESGEIIDAYAVDFSAERKNINVTAVKHTHSYSYETGKCACGAYPLAMFTESRTGDISFVTTVNELQTLATDEYRDGIIKLTEDISNSLSIKGVKTVDFNGHKFSGTILSNGNITFANSSSNRAEITTGVYILNKLTVNGDILFGNQFRATGSSADIVLNSGTYTKIVVTSGKTVFDLLPEGKALTKVDADGITVGLYDAGVTTAYEENYTLKIVAHPEHDFDEHSHCGCGYQCAHSAIDTESNLCKECNAIMRASVTADSGSKATVKYFTRLTDAFDFAAKDANKGCTVKMLSSYTNSDNFELSAGKFTLDLNGFNLIDNTLTVNDGAELTIKSDGENYNYSFDEITVNGGSLAIIGNAPTYYQTIEVNGGTFSIDAENMTASTLKASSGANVDIISGRFSEIKGTIDEFIAKGSCAYDLLNGEVRSYESLSDLYLTYDFGVKRCEHSGVSDSGLCAYCNTQFYEKLSYTADGTEKTEYFESLTEAINKANSVQTATMTILKDTPESYYDIIPDITGDLTLVLNANTYATTWHIKNGAKLAVSGSGVLYSIDAAKGSKVTAAGGVRLGDITINGEGEIGECSINILATGGKIADLLADGYAFKDKYGNWLTLEGRAKSNVQEVTVEKAPVASATVTANKTVLYRNGGGVRQILFNFNVNTSDGYTISKDNMVTVGLYVGDTLIRESDFGGNSSTFANADEIPGDDGTVKAHLVIKLNGYEYVTNEVEFELATCTHPYEAITTDEYDYYRCSLCDASINAILVKTNGDKVCYTDNVPEAFEAAQLEENNGCTLELYRCVTRDCEVTQGSFTVLFKKTGTASAVIKVSGGNVKITGDDGCAVLKYPGSSVEYLVAVTGGTVTFDNITIEDDSISVSGGEAVINGGTYNKLSVSGGTVALNGGTFSSINVSAEGKKLTDLLGEKKAFTTEDGALFNAYVTESSVKLTVTDHESHTLDKYGYCKCGYQCPHDDLDTESYVCRECNAKMYAAVIVKSKPETDEAESSEAEAKVYYFTKITEAFEFAVKSENEGCTLKMLRDFSDDSVDIDVNDGNFTVDMNGFGIYIDNFNGSGTVITIRSDSECTFAVNDDFNMDGGDVTFSGEVIVNCENMKLISANFFSDVETMGIYRLILDHGITVGQQVKIANATISNVNCDPDSYGIYLNQILASGSRIGYQLYSDLENNDSSSFNDVFITRCGHPDGVDGDNCCIYCNALMAASVSYTEDGAEKTEYFVAEDLEKAFDKANSVSSATVTMLNPSSYKADQLQLTVTGDVTLIANDYKALYNTVKVADGGKLTVRGNVKGYFAGVVAEAGSKLTVEEAVRIVDLTVNGGDVKLSGGQYSSITVNDGKITDILGNGYAYKKTEGGEWLTLEEREVSEVSGVTVAKAPIASASLSVGTPTVYRNGSNDEAGYIFDVAVSDGYTIDSEHKLNVKTYADGTLIETAGEDCDRNTDLMCVPIDELAPYDGVVKVHLVITLDGYEIKTNTIEIVAATCEHSYSLITTDQDGKYHCGTCHSFISAVLTTADGDNVCYVDMSKAFEDAQLEENSGCTLKLYSDTETSCYIKNGSFTVDFFGETGTTTNGVITVSGGNVTFTGKAGVLNDIYDGCIVKVTGGKATFDNAELEGSIAVSGGEVVINSGTYDMLAAGGGDVELNGGTYRVLMTTADGKTVCDMLGEKKALTKEADGTLIDASVDTCYLDEGLIKVADHESHTFSNGKCDCGYYCKHDNIDTDTGKCTDCDIAPVANITYGDGVTKGFNSLVEAFEFISENAPENCLLTVTDDVQIGEDVQPILVDNDFTMQFRSSKGRNNVKISGGNITFTGNVVIRNVWDQSVGNKIESNITQNGGSFAVEGESDLSINGKFTLYAGDLHLDSYATTFADMTINNDIYHTPNIVNATFIKLTLVDRTLADVMAKDSYVETIKGNVPVEYDSVKDVSVIENIHITNCTHFFNESYAIDDNGRCPYCNHKYLTKVNYEYENGIKGLAYFDTLKEAVEIANDAGTAAITLLSECEETDVPAITGDVKLVLGGRFKNTITVADGGKLTLSGDNTLYKLITEEGSQLDVYGNSIIEYAEINGSATLADCTVYFLNTSGKLSALLADGYGYKAEQTGWLTLEEREKSEASFVTVTKAPILGAALTADKTKVYREGENGITFTLDFVMADGFTLDAGHAAGYKLYIAGEEDFSTGIYTSSYSDEIREDLVWNYAGKDGKIKAYAVISYDGYEVLTNELEIEAVTCKNSAENVVQTEDGKYKCSECDNYVCFEITTKSGDAEYTYSIADALERIQSDPSYNGSTIKTVTERKNISYTGYDVEGVDFTFDLNGHYVDIDSKMTVSNSTVVFKDSAGNGTLRYYGGGIQNECITFKNSVVTVESGKYDSVFNIGEGCTVKLNGGTFCNIEINDGDKTLYDLLGENKAFETESGLLFDAGSTTYSTETLNVVEHKHTFNYYGKCDCGAQYSASVSYKDGETEKTEYFKDIAKAFEKANSLESATVTTLNYIENSDEVIPVTGNVTFNVGRPVYRTLNVASDGKLTVVGEEYKNIYRVKTEAGSQLTVSGDILIENAEINGSASISGGKILLLVTSGKISDVLADGYAFKNINEEWLTVEERSMSGFYSVTIEKAPIVKAKLSADKTKAYRNGDNEIIFTISADMADGMTVNSDNRMYCTLYIAGNLVEKYAENTNNSMYYIEEYKVWNYAGKDGKAKVYTVVSYDGYEVLTNELELETVTCKNSAEKVVKTSDGRYKCSECGNYVYYEITSKDGSSEYTYSITDAFERIQQASSYNGCVIKSVCEPEKIFSGADVKGADFTFDLNGYGADISSKMTVTDSTVVFKDSANSGIFNYYGGNIGNEGITFKNSSITVESGKYYSIFNIGEGCTVNITGGTFRNIEVHDGDKALHDLLGENKAFATGYGKLFDAYSASSSDELLTVIDHSKHEFDEDHHCGCGFTCTEHKGGKATCTEKAKCEICGGEYGEPLGHDYSERIVPPTYASEGYTVFECSRCHDSYTGNFVPKKAVPNVTEVTVESSTYDEVLISWDAVEDVTKYLVECYVGGQWKQMAYNTVEDRVFADVVGLSSGLTYKIRIKTYVDSIEGGYLYSYIDTVSSPVWEIKTISATDSTVKIGWNRNTRADGYRVEWFVDNEWVYKDISGNENVTATIDGLDAGTQYKVRVSTYRGEMISPSTYGYINTLPAEVNEYSATATSSTVTLNWSEVNSADGYIIEYYAGGKWNSTTVTGRTVTTATISGLRPNSIYKMRIKSYKGELESVCSDIYALTAPARVTGIKVTSAIDSTAAISWTADSSVDGYVVEYYIGGKWSQQTLTGNTVTAATLGGLTPYSVYKVRVRAFKDNLMGDYSYINVSTVLSAVTGVKTVTAYNNAVSVTWDANKSAAGYTAEIYLGGRWKQVKTLSDLNNVAAFTDLKSDSRYRIRIAAYKGNNTTDYTYAYINTTK